MACEWQEPIETPSNVSKRNVFRQDYRRCCYNGLDVAVGDFVFVSGFAPKDRSQTETADDWDVAEIQHLYDSGNCDDPPRERAFVRWFTRVRALPRKPPLPPAAGDGWPPLHETCEVVHDTRPYRADVMLNCVMDKCQVHVVAGHVAATDRVATVCPVNQRQFTARFSYHHSSRGRLVPLPLPAVAAPESSPSAAAAAAATTTTATETTTVAECGVADNNNNNTSSAKNKDGCAGDSPLTPSIGRRPRHSSRTAGNYRNLLDGEADWKDYSGLTVSYTSPDKLRMRIKCSESPVSKYSPSVQSPLVASPTGRRSGRCSRQRRSLQPSPAGSALWSSSAVAPGEEEEEGSTQRQQLRRRRASMAPLGRLDETDECDNNINNNDGDDNDDDDDIGRTTSAASTTRHSLASVKRRLTLPAVVDSEPSMKRARAADAGGNGGSGGGGGGGESEVLSPLRRQYRSSRNTRLSLPAALVDECSDRRHYSDLHTSTTINNINSPVASPAKSASSPAKQQERGRGRPPRGRGRSRLDIDDDGSESDIGLDTSPTRTPKRSRKSSQCPTPKSPISPRTPRTPRAGRAGRTPSRRLPLSPCTPLSLCRTPGSFSAAAASPLQLARRQLHAAAVPSHLPCRRAEFSDIRAFIVTKLTAADSGCMYVSGVPGTGKTATMREVVRSLNQDVADGHLPDFQFIEVNGMRLTEPARVYSQILLELSGERATPEHAASLLDQRFSGGAGSRGGGRRLPIVLLVDELDLLWTRKQEVLYNLFDWPSRAGSSLIVVAIANTMDLPERVMQHRVSSRLGLTRRTFLPYSYKQLQQIVETRLAGLEAFDSDAVQLVARKVAAVSGDARRALDICRRATEIAEATAAARPPTVTDTSCVTDGGDARASDHHKQLVSMAHVNQAVQEMFSAPKIVAIRSCTVLEKSLLRAIVMEFQRTGLEEARFAMVHDHLTTICRYEDIVPPTVSESLQLVAQLASIRLLAAEAGHTDLACRIRLNVLADDVSYAVRDADSAEAIAAAG